MPLLGVHAGGKGKYAPSLTMEREVALALICAGLFNLAQVEEARGRLSEAHIPQLLARVLEQSRRCVRADHRTR